MVWESAALSSASVRVSTPTAAQAAFEVVNGEISCWFHGLRRRRDTEFAQGWVWSCGCGGTFQAVPLGCSSADLTGKL